MSIPIVGQPKVGDFSFSMVVTCTCERVFIWQGRPGNGGPGTICACPGCSRPYTVTRMPIYHPVTGEMQVTLAAGVAPPQ